MTLKLIACAVAMFPLCAVAAKPVVKRVAIAANGLAQNGDAITHPQKAVVRKVGHTSRGNARSMVGVNTRQPKPVVRKVKTSATHSLNKITTVGGLSSLAQVAKCDFQLGYKCVDDDNAKPAGEANVTTQSECFDFCEQTGPPGACCQFNVNNHKCRLWADTQVQPEVASANNKNKMAFQVGCSQACTVTLYEHWSEDIQESLVNSGVSPEMLHGLNNWRPKFPTGLSETWNGTGQFKLGATSGLVSSVKVTGSCCKAYGYEDADCTQGSPNPIESDTVYEALLGAGVVAPASNLEHYWRNDRVQCVKVEQCGHSEGSVSGLDAFQTELLHLAGDVSAHGKALNPGVLEGMGWKKGATIHDTTMGFKDTAQIYSKDNGVCAIAFSATDDDLDNMQQMNGVQTPTTFCGFDGINSGYVQEMVQYMNLSNWSLGMTELMQCSDVWAVGHSMGGAMASLFAFCANTNSVDFQGLPEVALMLASSPEVATTPLYNGAPGTCFKGVRAAVSHEAKIPGPQFYIDVSEMLASTMGAMAMNTTQVDQAIAMMKFAVSSNDSITFEGVKSQLMPGFDPLGIVVYGIAQNVSMPGVDRTHYPAILDQIEQIIHNHFTDVSLPFDPIPESFRGLGNVHPLVSFQAMPLPNVTVPSVVPLVTCDSSTVSAVPTLPSHDLQQLLIGALLGRQMLGSFPNHDWCALAPDYADCKSKRNSTCVGDSCNYATINPAVVANIAV